MKKKIFGAALIAAMAITAGWNFNQSKNEIELSNLALANVEALANTEDNPWYLWPAQGTTRDEWAEEKECTEGINLGIYYVEWKGTRIICHDGGTQNCTTQICSE